MGYFDGMTASAYREQDGEHYYIGWRQQRRFLSKMDYERSRSRLETIYGICAAFGLASIPVGRHVGFIWVIAAAVIFVAWLLIFGQGMVTANSVPANIDDDAKDRLDREVKATGRPMLWAGTIGSALFVVGGVIIMILNPKELWLGLGVIVFFGLCAVVWGRQLLRVKQLDGAPSSADAGLTRLIELRDKGVLAQQEFDTQKAGYLALPLQPSPRKFTPWLIAAGALGVLAVGGVSYGLLNRQTALAESPIDIVARADAGDGEQSAANDTVATGDSGFSPAEDALITQASNAWDDFRNSVPGGEARHTALLGTLFERGICWGRTGEFQADYAYHRCDSHSLQTQSVAQATSVDAAAEIPKRAIGRCLLRINGANYIDGNCEIDMRSDGTFQVMALDQSYFATVLGNGDSAEGYWNESAGGTHAHTSLGTLTRNGNCWENQAAQVCAWQR